MLLEQLHTAFRGQGGQKGPCPPNMGSALKLLNVASDHRDAGTRGPHCATHPRICQAPHAPTSSWSDFQDQCPFTTFIFLFFTFGSQMFTDEDIQKQPHTQGNLESESPGTGSEKNSEDLRLITQADLQHRQPTTIKQKQTLSTKVSKPG